MCDIYSVEKKVKEVFAKRLKVPFEIISSLDSSVNLLGKKIGLSHREIIYLIYDLEKEFDITFPQNNLVSEDTYTLQALSSIILVQINVRMKA